MEDLVDRLDSSHVTLDETDTRLIHPRFRQLRRTPLICNQDERRHEWLNNLRSKRLDKFNAFRGIQERIGSQKVLTSEYKPYAVREYKGWLMLSEWMIEAPLDFSNEWICTICPEGKRALVVAHMGITKAYKRNGDFVCGQFSSWLPGGSKYNNPKDTTIIDTIFDRTNSVFYVLDVLHWGVDLTESSAEMRMFWLSSRLKEIPELKEKFKSNRYNFLLLDSIPITDLPLLMKRHPLFPLNSPKVDGILFFHKESTYVHSRSPLCLWLRPFMLPKILGIEIALEYSQEMPQTYQKMEVEVTSENEHKMT